jgi:hypothetical protein
VVVWRRGDRTKQGEMKGRRAVEGVTLGLLFGVAFFFNVCRTWQPYFGGCCSGPEFRLSPEGFPLFCGLLLGNGGDAQLGNHFQLQEK